MSSWSSVDNVFDSVSGAGVGHGPVASVSVEGHLLETVVWPNRAAEHALAAIREDTLDLMHGGGW